jgi:phytoene dehydrogenase-like protein
MSEAYDAVVIGAGVNGLAAATYLATAGRKVLVTEARSAPGGLCDNGTFGTDTRYSRAAHALYTLDPRVVKELRLARHGLAFTVRDMPLVGLRPDGKHLTITRDVFGSARNIAIQSEADAQTWTRFRREWYALAYKMRALWWWTDPPGRDVILQDDRIASVARLGSAAWLDFWFESEALKATLAFDAHGQSPLAAGSALLLIWRAAQEMCGLQGAVALPRGGMTSVSAAFVAAAKTAGVDMRTGARVTDILVDDGGDTRGVLLESGEPVAAPLVLSSLSRGRTLSLPSPRSATGFAEKAAFDRRMPGTSVARVTLALDVMPEMSGSKVPATARFIVVERIESLAAAHASAYAGRLPQELTMEVILPAASDPAGKCLISVLVGPVPAHVEGGWRGLKADLAARVIAALAHYLPGIGRHLVGADIMSPDDARDIYGADDAFGGAIDVQRLLSGWRARVTTPVRGLVLCGPSADPVGAVSGRAGRMAATYALESGARP